MTLAAPTVGRGMQHEQHWSERAGALLGPLLYAANRSGRPIADVLRWVLRHELIEPSEVLAREGAAVACDVLEGIARTDERERSSIFSATAGVLALYNTDSARAAAARPNFDPDVFAASTDTVFITAPRTARRSVRRLWSGCSSGGRAPAEHERQLVEDAIKEIQAKDPSVRTPAMWFVLDDWQLNAAAFGDALMVHTGALADPGLGAVIAHELGHLNSTDSYLSVALGRLTWPAACFARLANRSEGGGCLTGLFFLAGDVCSGLIVVPLTRPLWSAWFRRREFIADEYAAKLGFAEELADALARHALEDDRPRPFQFISADSHPYTTYRTDALHSYASRQANVVA